METLNKLREHLANITQEEFDRVWREVEDVGEKNKVLLEDFILVLQEEPIGGLLKNNIKVKAEGNNSFCFFLLY